MTLHARLSAGYSLVELMVVVAIVAVLASLAMPAVSGMLAEQRVRTVATELLGELTHARAEAIKQHRRVVVAHGGSGTGWNQGVQVYVATVDVATGNLVQSGATLRSLGAFTGTNLKICGMTSDFDSMIVFRGDGSVANATPGTETGIRVADDQGRGSAYVRSRNILISPAGRASIENPGTGSGGVPSCG